MIDLDRLEQELEQALTAEVRAMRRASPAFGPPRATGVPRAIARTSSASSLAARLATISDAEESPAPPEESRLPIASGGGAQVVPIGSRRSGLAVRAAAARPAMAGVAARERLRRAAARQAAEDTHSPADPAPRAPASVADLLAQGRIEEVDARIAAREAELDRPVGGRAHVAGAVETDRLEPRF